MQGASHSAPHRTESRAAAGKRWTPENGEVKRVSMHEAGKLKLLKLPALQLSGRGADDQFHEVKIGGARRGAQAEGGIVLPFSSLQDISTRERAVASRGLGN